MFPRDTSIRINAPAAEPWNQRQAGSDAMFLRNVWYVAGFSNDIARGHLLGRKFLGESVVLFRTQAGVLGALEDRCCHRAMPLSEGHVEGDIIRCCYHGIEFDTTGACTCIPGQDRIPPQASIRSYPIVERDNVVWIWMGDPEDADSTMILPNPELSDPNWTWRSVYFHIQTNYQLLIDNILDLTHLAYVHARTIGGNAQMHFATPTHVKNEGGKIRVIRHMPNSVPPPTYVKAAGFKGLVDRWQEVEFAPKMGIALRVSAGACDVDTGAYEGKRDHGFSMINFHGATPETETTTHYIWSIATNAPRDSGISELIFDQINTTIKEDEAVLEAQQRRISETPDVTFVGIASNGGVNQGRRLLRSLFESERPSVHAGE